MANHDYPMVVQALTEEEGGGYLAAAPDLHGCVADGDTPEAALADLRHAIEEWVDEAKRLNRKVPLPGEYATRARNEREQITGLIEAQDKLIKQQDQRLQEARAEIEKIKARISEFYEFDEKGERSYGRWAEVAPVHVAALARRKQPRLPH